MSARHLIKGLVLAAVFIAGSTLPAFADPLQPVQVGNVTYVSGGIGDDERASLEAGAPAYNLKITNADPTGHFVANTDLQIVNKAGEQMLKADATGPLFYAKLPAGRYTVKAMNAGEQRTQSIEVTESKTTKLHLTWQES